jgi:nicotinate-nucleotide adenylyltransferase
MLMMKKVGILAGTFDPVHQGHIAFALAAASVAGLEKIVFLPEAKPRRKHQTTSIKHRLAMLELALKPYKQLEVLNLNQEQFTVADTLPKIEKRFPGSELYLLVGSDVLPSLKKWPNIDKLVDKVKIISGQRLVNKPKPKSADTINIYTNFADLSSSAIRAKLPKVKTPHGITRTVADYIAKNKLYAGVSASAA